MRNLREFFPEYVILDLSYEEKKAKIQLVNRYGKHDAAQLYYGNVPRSELLEVSGRMIMVTQCQMINLLVYYDKMFSVYWIGSDEQN